MLDIMKSSGIIIIELLEMTRNEVNIMREWLRSLRMERGITMKDMGKRLGISESYYCAIENGDRQRNMDMLIASGISTIFDVPVSEVVAKDQAWRRAGQA